MDHVSEDHDRVGHGAQPVGEEAALDRRRLLVGEVGAQAVDPPVGLGNHAGSHNQRDELDRRVHELEDGVVVPRLEGAQQELDSLCV